MFKLRNGHFIAASAVIALFGSSVPVGVFAAGPPTAAPAVVQASESMPLSAGTMTLSFEGEDGSTGVVEWGDVRQEFTSGDKNCRLEPTPGTADLIDFRGYIGTLSSSAGFREGKIGVYEFKTQDGGPWNAAQCFRVDAGSFTPKETLGLQLGDDAGDAFGPLVVTEASLSLSAASSWGKIDAVLVDAEGAIVSTRQISWNGLSNNDPIDLDPFVGEFSGVKLTAKSGKFSLVGATFEVATQADDVFCAEGSDNTFTNDSGVTVTFLGNADGSECSGFGIRLTGTEDAKVWFIKPLDVDPEAQFIFEVPWDTVGWPALTLGSELPQAFIDFEESDPPNEIEMGYCPDYLFDESGTLVGLDETSNQADRDALALLDMIPDVEGDLRTDGTQFACIGDRTGSVEKSAGSGYDVGLTDLIYLIGDARMSLK